MPSYQQVIVIGNLGHDPEIRSLPSGDSVANFSVATSEKWTEKDGAQREETEWHRIVVYGKSVNSYVAPYLRKGDLVTIRGKLKTRQWEKDGEKRYSTEIVADRFAGVQGLGGKRQGGSTPASAAQPAGQGQPAPQQGTVAGDGVGSDIPF